MNVKSVQYKDLNDFLAKHNANLEKKDSNNTVLTHTRIPDKTLNIYGGSYIISKEDEPDFWKLYYNAVFVNKKLEYWGVFAGFIFYLYNNNNLGALKTYK